MIYFIPAWQKPLDCRLMTYCKQHQLGFLIGWHETSSNGTRLIKLTVTLLCNCGPAFSHTNKNHDTLWVICKVVESEELAGELESEELACLWHITHIMRQKKDVLDFLFSSAVQRKKEVKGGEWGRMYLETWWIKRVGCFLNPLNLFGCVTVCMPAPYSWVDVNQLDLGHFGCSPLQWI